MSPSEGSHVRIYAGDIIHDRYEVMGEIGCGNFAKVYRCIDKKKLKMQQSASSQGEPSNIYVALKVVKKKYKNDCVCEIKTLKTLVSHQKSKAIRIPKLLSYFEYKDCPAIVMELHGQPLRNRALGIERGAVTKNSLQLFAYKFLRMLQFIHEDCHIVHTDLKPENILMLSPMTERGIGKDWVICDFGNASECIMSKLDSDLIATRPYRAPEVILGNKWHYASDIWSAGCVLYEIAVGKRLFEVRDDVTHLHAIEHMIGRLPEKFTKHSKYSSKFFTSSGLFLSASERQHDKTLLETFPSDAAFADLLLRLLELDPDTRISARGALEHRYFDSIRPRMMEEELAGMKPSQQLEVTHCVLKNPHLNASSPNGSPSHAAAVAAVESKSASSVAKGKDTVSAKNPVVLATRTEKPAKPLPDRIRPTSREISGTAVRGTVLAKTTPVAAQKKVSPFEGGDSESNGISPTERSLEVSASFTRHSHEAPPQPAAEGEGEHASPGKTTNEAATVSNRIVLKRKKCPPQSRPVQVAISLNSLSSCASRPLTPTSGMTTSATPVSQTVSEPPLVIATPRARDTPPVLLLERKQCLPGLDTSPGQPNKPPVLKPQPAARAGNSKSLASSPTQVPLTPHYPTDRRLSLSIPVGFNDLQLYGPPPQSVPPPPPSSRQALAEASFGSQHASPKMASFVSSHDSMPLTSSTHSPAGLGNTVGCPSQPTIYSVMKTVKSHPTALSQRPHTSELASRSRTTKTATPVKDKEKMYESGASGEVRRGDFPLPSRRIAQGNEAKREVMDPIIPASPFSSKVASPLLHNPSSDSLVLKSVSVMPRRASVNGPLVENKAEEGAKAVTRNSLPPDPVRSSLAMPMSSSTSPGSFSPLLPFREKRASKWNPNSARGGTEWEAKGWNDEDAKAIMAQEKEHLRSRSDHRFNSQSTLGSRGVPPRQRVCESAESMKSFLNPAPGRASECSRTHKILSSSAPLVVSHSPTHRAREDVEHSSAKVEGGSKRAIMMESTTKSYSFGNQRTTPRSSAEDDQVKGHSNSGMNSHLKSFGKNLEPLKGRKGLPPHATRSKGQSNKRITAAV